MKANELMIGDWVRIKDPDKYAGATGKICSLTALEGGYYAINISDVHFGYLMTEVFCEDIEPIPLMAEILEKNGFVNNDGDFRFFKADEESYYFGFESVHYYFETHFCNVTKEFSQVGLQNQSKGIFTYVHQLQHALRLCGIDKEITL